MDHNEYQVTVDYVGHEAFSEEVQGDPVFEEIKRKAMKDFDLEASSASKYVLQHDGIDLDDKRHISSLALHTIVLTLTLKTEPVKG